MKTTTTVLTILLALFTAGCAGESNITPISPIVEQPDCASLGDFSPADSIIERTYLIQYISSSAAKDQDFSEQAEKDHDELKRTVDVEEVRAIVAREMVFQEKDIWVETWTAHLAADEALSSGCYPERGRAQVLLPEAFLAANKLSLGDRITLVNDREFIISGTYHSESGDDALPVFYVSDELDRPEAFDELLIVFNQRASTDYATQSLFNHFTGKHVPVLITNIKTGESFSTEEL